MEEYQIMYCEGANVSILVHKASGAMQKMLGTGKCELKLSKRTQEWYVAQDNMSPVYCYKFFSWSDNGDCMGSHDTLASQISPVKRSMTGLPGSPNSESPTLKRSKTGLPASPNSESHPLKRSKTGLPGSPRSESKTPIGRQGHEVLGISTKRDSLTASSLKGLDVPDATSETSKNLALAFAPLDSQVESQEVIDEESQVVEAQVEESQKVNNCDEAKETLLPLPPPEKGPSPGTPLSAGDIPSSPEEEGDGPKKNQPLPSQGHINVPPVGKHSEASSSTQQNQ